MEEKNTKKRGVKFALGIGLGIILSKLFFEKLLPMFL